MFFNLLDRHLLPDELFESHDLENISFAELAVDSEERVDALSEDLAWFRLSRPTPVLVDVVVVFGGVRADVFPSCQNFITILTLIASINLHFAQLHSCVDVLLRVHELFYAVIWVKVALHRIVHICYLISIAFHSLVFVANLESFWEV